MCVPRLRSDGVCFFRPRSDGVDVFRQRSDGLCVFRPPSDGMCAPRPHHDGAMCMSSAETNVCVSRLRNECVRADSASVFSSCSVLVLTGQGRPVLSYRPDTILESDSSMVSGLQDL